MHLGMAFCLIGAILTNGAALHAQATPAAIRSLVPTVGVTYNVFAPDDGEGHIQGFAVFASVNVGKHLGLEGLARRTDFVTPYDVGEQTYLLGPTYKHSFGRFSPYVKAMGGIGVLRLQLGYNSSSSTYRYGVFAYGGGLDISLSSRVVLRAVDYERQSWPHFPPHGLTPNGLSSGLAYRF